jgi:transcriptional regulator with XRE-family HTH domain
VDGKTRLQVCSEKAREIYANDLDTPLLMQLCKLHNLSVAEFGEIFGISRAQAYKVLNHEDFPSLPVAIAIARYWDVDVEFLFGWRVDDDGSRRPLLIENPSTQVLIRLKSSDPEASVPALIEARMEYLKRRESEGI